MVEQAFRVAKGSQFYNDYFEAYAEKQKMHDLAREFFGRHGLCDDHLGYRMTSMLAMQLTPEQEERFSSQLKVTKDTQGMRYFKKTSPMNKEWRETVCDKVDFSIMDKQWCWYWHYINKGRYALWHQGDEVYGYLSDEHRDKIELPEYMIPIKMSEYYAVQEERHEESKQL